jgi:peptidoglycan-associated lipoprotein
VSTGRRVEGEGATGPVGGTTETEAGAGEAPAKSEVSDHPRSAAVAESGAEPPGSQGEVGSIAAAGGAAQASSGQEIGSIAAAGRAAQASGGHGETDRGMAELEARPETPDQIPAQIPAGDARPGPSGVPDGDGRPDREPMVAAASPEPKEFAPTDALRNIFFDFDAYDIRPGEAAILDANVDWLRSNPNYLVLIEGHCDERGTNEYNIALGEHRARAAMNYLVAHGIPASRLTTFSYGEERPLCTEHTEACWASNRRAHFLIRPTTPPR